MYVPKKKPSSKTVPWEKHIPRNITKQCSKLWNEYKLLRQTNGRLHHLALQKLLFKAIEINAQLKNLVLQSKINYESNLIEQCYTKPKLFHSCIKKKKKIEK